MSTELGYKSTELGLMPEGWKIANLGVAIVTIRNGVSRELSSNDIGYPVIRSTNIVDNELDLNDLKFWHMKDPQGVDLTEYILKEGDILVNFINSIDEIGKSCIFAEQKRPFIYTTNIFRLRLNRQILDHSFFHYFAQSQLYWSQIHRIVKPAVHQASFTQEDFRKISVPTVPRAEQEKIISILLAVDTSIQKTQEIIVKTQQLKKGLMQQLLTKGIGHTKFKHTEIGEIPYEWQEVRLGDVCKLLPGYAFRSSEFVESGVKLLRGANIGIEEIRWEDTEYFPKERLTEFSDYVLNGGEVVIGMDRPFVKDGLKVAILPPNDGPCLLVQRVGKFIPSGRITVGFLYGYLRCKIFRTHLRLRQQGMDLPHISQTDVESAPLPLPPLEEQIVLGKIVAAIDAKNRIEIVRKSKLASIKRGLMQVLLTGKVRVKVN